LHSCPTRRSSDLQGSAGAWASAGEEQRPACRFPEASREQRRIGQVVDQELLDLLRFEDEVGGVGGLVGVGKAKGDPVVGPDHVDVEPVDRKSTRLNSSHVKISYAVFCLKKKNKAS